MQEKISVHENPTLSKKLLGFALAIIALVVALFVLSQPVVSILIGNTLGGSGVILFFIVVATPPIIAIYWGMGWIGSKTTATPILSAGKLVPYNAGQVAFVHGGAAAGIWGAVEGSSNVFLCKEGVVIKRFMITMLYPWKRIREFAANPVNRRVWLNFGLGYYVNRPLIQVGENFGEVEKILSEHIAKRVPV